MASVFRRAYDVFRANLETKLSSWEERAERRSRPEPEAADPTSGGEQKRHQVDRDPELARYYSNLEVPYGSDLETVRESWKRLVRKYHPDLHGSDPERQAVATELVKGLNHAFHELESTLKQ